MEEIKITQTDKGFFVEQGNKQAEQLCWNEMLGTVAALTMPDHTPCLQWMKEKEKPCIIQDGDFVAMPCGKDLTYIAIFNGIWNGMVKGYAITNGKEVKVKDANICPFDFFLEDSVDQIRLATEKEKQFLLSKLAEQGKQWNPEKKCIENVWKPKDGDFVTAYNRRVLICRNPIVNKDYIGYDFDTYASLELHSKYLSISDPHYIEQLDIRPASEEEKQILLDALHKVGKEWDAEKKKVIKYKWKPKYGEDYFTLEFERSKGGFYVLKTRWTDEPDDMLNLAFNLVFRTKEGAQKKVDKSNERLKQ